MVDIKENYPLLSLHTFGVNVKAKAYAAAYTTDELKAIFQSNVFHKFLVLGGGSNILFLGDFNGLVVQPLMPQIEVLSEDFSDVRVEVFAGVVWDDFVSFCVKNNWGGIENLSLIPGRVGACPIQNIGAYGTEIKDVLHAVKGINLETGEDFYFTNSSCCFGYRTSIFKQNPNKYLITSVVFHLKKNPKPNLEYQALKDAFQGFTKIGIEDIRNKVVEIRTKKLPDPSKVGNAGSFFKNPEISNEVASTLSLQYPEMPLYPSNQKGCTKTSAAWLIEKCGWKGYRVGDAGVHTSQPLVLVNYGKATGLEILALAKSIQHSIMEQFSISLEMEVNLIS